VPKRADLLCVLFKVLAALTMSAAVLAQPAVDTTTPRIAINQEATDTSTRLELLQQELYAQQQEVMFLTLLRQYDDRMLIRRALFPSGAELVPAYIFSPKPVDRGRGYPGLVIVHGGFHGRLEWRFFDLIDHAVRAGYVVIFPEYRGSAGYGDVHYQNGYGTTDVADVLASVDYLVKSTPHVDARRIGIYGHSRGGLVTLLAVEKEPRKFKAAVDVAGLADMVAFMAYKPDFRRQATAAEPQFGGKLPSENLAPYMEISPLNYVDAIETPLFVAATTGDKVVPMPLHTGRLIDALKARNKTFEVKIYDHAPGDHVFLFGDTDERRDLFERTFAFLAKYLKL
jgi:dipeptidyl aminopeptidase/acylaminoacyl peptidase